MVTVFADKSEVGEKVKENDFTANYANKITPINAKPIAHISEN